MLVLRELRCGATAKRRWRVHVRATVGSSSRTPSAHAACRVHVLRTMTSFGDPNAPKFCYGRKEDPPTSWDLNWRNQIAKEKREMAHNQKLNEQRRKGMTGSLSSRQYHPSHVPVAPSAAGALGRIRLGVCGTFIHEEGGAELAPERKDRKRRDHTARSGGGAGGGGGRVGELERAGGLARYADVALSHRSAAISGRGGYSARSGRSAASAASSGLRDRLDSETRARQDAERKIAELELEVKRLRAGLALRP